MIIFSFVGTNPQFATVEIVVKMEKVRGEIFLELRTFLAVLTKVTYRRSNTEPTRFITRW